MNEEVKMRVLPPGTRERMIWNAGQNADWLGCPVSLRSLHRGRRLKAIRLRSAPPMLRGGLKRTAKTSTGSTASGSRFPSGSAMPSSKRHCFGGSEKSAASVACRTRH
jgi:hypothetical protein